MRHLIQALVAATAMSAFGPAVVAFQGIAKRDGSFAGQFEQHNPAIDLAKTANVAWTRNYTWTIDK